MQWPQQVKLVEVSPRDGLQNESKQVPTELKIKFINQLSQCGFAAIEVSSFVSKKKILQLADHDAVLRGIDKAKHVSYPVLVPNMQGLAAAQAAGAEAIAVFTAVSESFTQANINCSIAQSLQDYQTVISAAKKAQMQVRAYISCVLGCPYEGYRSPALAAELAEKLWGFGCDEICLGDTIGIATALQAQALVAAVKEKIPSDRLTLHFHDTYGQALTNIYATLQQGIASFDCAVSGMGGCPYAHGASGNVASEDVVYLLQGLDIDSGVDLKQLISAGHSIDQFLQRETGSKVAKAMSADHG